MLVTTVAGPGRTRGLEYGEEVARGIGEAASALKTHLASAGHSPGRLGRRLQTSPLVHAAQQWTPDLWDEVTGIAYGSRVDLADVLLLTFLDEVWGVTRESGCSVIARRVPGRAGETPVPPITEIGQTMDLPAWTTDRMMVLRVGTPDCPSALLMAYPGIIGLCGANEAGLGVAVNALTNGPVDESGLGVAFVVRHLLTLTTLADAAAFVTAVPHAAAQAYTIAAPDGIATFEASAQGVVRIEPSTEGTLIHSNHWLALAGSATPPSESSTARWDLLRSAAEAHVPMADLLTGDLVLDGVRWGDRHLTLGSFRAVGSEAAARFVDGARVRAGRPEWTRLAYR